MSPVLDLFRLFIGASILAFASYTDWQWRRAPNVLWIVTAAAGLVLLLVEAALDWSGFVARWPYLVGVLGLVGFIFALWWLGLLAGGADAKALMALALLLPFPVALGNGLPPLASFLPGGFVALGNSLIAFMLVPLGFVVWNVAHGDLRFPQAILGMKLRAADVKRGHQWPLETIDETGARRNKFFASRMSDEEIEATFERVQALGDERVWVSPKIPFMIPLLVGFVLTFLVGDLLTGAVFLVFPAP